jgi:hypothetical protein
MYRIVFISLCPHRKRLVIERGPMHPNKDVVERWLDYFMSLGHTARMQIERVRANEQADLEAGRSRPA